MAHHAAQPRRQPPRALARTPAAARRGAWLAAAALGLWVASTTGCAPATRRPSGLQVREITPRFLLDLDALDPALAADGHGHVALTWVSRDSTGADVWLSVSRDGAKTFNAPRRVNLAAGRVVSFAEGRPVPVLGPAGALAVAWSERRADTSGAVDLRIRASADLGNSLGNVVTLNDDAAGPPPELGWSDARAWQRHHNVRAFHGFPAITFLPDGALFAAWLDERNPAPIVKGEPRSSSLYSSLSLDGGQTWTANTALSDSACPCCRPDVALGPGGAIALAWRDASDDLRDPVLAVSPDGGRTFGPDTIVSRDRWYLDACPDQGPRLVWSGPQGGQYVWLTGAAPAGAYVVPWRTARGAAGMRRSYADSLPEAVHPMIATLGRTTLLGLETRSPRDETHHVLALRSLDRAGALTPWTFLGADAGAGWVVSAGSSQALVCWVEHDAERQRLRLASLAPQAP